MWANLNNRRNFEIDYPDRKGSLTLRSTHQTYGRPVLVLNWYQHREAEPKDYDVDTVPEGCHKNLHRSTYKRFRSVPEGDWSTTTEECMSQVNLKGDYRQREKVPIADHRTVAKELFKRTSGCLDSSANAALPRHSPDHSKMFFETTYNHDYVPTTDFVPHPDEGPEEDGDYRRCHSQFVDTDDYRRHGRNTWLNESGIYANAEIKKALFPPFNPIASRLI
ncbi:protein C9orf135-like [Scyliorhinus canicula]|uniref:protein C9orf135-like n=1 Tax=Scyliorhinus canicula TaxID=7830 RepID=UPI0018F7784F|nr:protein C9orf135-like [Scyliorhinus canicula]